MVHFGEASEHVSRRQFLRAALAIGGVAAAGSVSACAGLGHAQDTQPQQAKPQQDLTIGFVPIACAAPLLAAHGIGAFAQQGLNVRLRKFAGWADLWTAYATGELDVAHMLSPMPVALDAGLTMAARPTQLAFTQNTNGQALTLAARHVDRVQGPEDLRGMVLGIPFEYSVHALLLRDFLATAGVDPVRDVELRLLRPADMVAQLAVGTIDGFIGPEPFNQRALASGAGRIFVPTKQMWDGHPCCSVAVAKEVDGAVRDRIVAALHQGAQVVNSPSHQAIEQLAQEKYLNQKADLIAAALHGEYTSWQGQKLRDPDLLRFGDATSATAIVWMAAQLARWDLGLALADAPIITAAHGVLPPEADRSTEPIVVNGRAFDPRHPAAGLSVGR